MIVEEALELVEEIKNCSLPWDDSHWEALDIVINYVKDKLNKSLRPQNRWKPSDEQMLALNIAIEMEDGDILKSLYQDLLKLKE